MELSRRAFLAGLAVMPFSAAPLPDSVFAGGRKFFDPQQFEAVAALSEVILPRTDTPGARDVHVPEYIDAILAVSPEEVQARFCAGLKALDGEAPFSRLPAKEQSAAVAAALGDRAAPNHAFAEHAKLLVARIYYATEAGQAELNKGNRVPATYY